MAFTPIDDVLGPATPKKSSFTPLDDAQGALAQSQMLVDNAFRSPLQAIAEGDAGANVERLKGTGKQALSEFSSAGIHKAGPVGQAMMSEGLAKGNTFAQGLQGLDQAVQPSNIEQAKGMAETGLAEAVLPMKPLVNSLSNSSLLRTLGQKSGVSKFLAERATKKATDAVKSTVDTMTKGERETAILEGRLKPKVGGGGTYVPSETEKRAGEILTKKMTKNPIKDVPVIQNEIAQRGKEAEQFLGMNGRAISNEEDFQMFKEMKEKASKYLTPEQMKNYDHTIKQFEGELKGMGNYNTGTYYKALKNFEQNVTARLRQGNEALLTDSGSAQLQAAKDVRKAVRDMIGNKHPEFKGKMYDLASLYDALDNVVTKAAKTDTFSKRHPILSKALKYGAEAIGAGAIYGGAREAGAPLP